MKRKKKSIGFAFALNGLKEVLKTEQNFRIHISVALFVVFTGIFLKISLSEWSIVILVIGLVLITELINSAIEKIIDYIKPEIHPAAKVIKDIGAGSVLIATIIAIVIGMIVFLPKIISLWY